MPSEPEKRSSDGIFACNSNAPIKIKAHRIPLSGASRPHEFGVDARTPTDIVLHETREHSVKL
ncbi:MULTISPECIES: peptide chain release factor [Neisseria]|uniref:peptide chain release factor n=1 Tax=Neisseria TaxID=482 RepID=UPI001EFD6C93